MAGRLVVVSNRVSVPGARGAAAGGLAVGLQAALRERGGLWFGWSGAHCDEPVEKPSIVEKDKVTYALLDLSREEHRGYYAGFSNRALWPICHYRIDLASFDPHAYATYRKVNARFAAALKPLLRDDDVIWVHDYHLVPLAGELRRLGCGHRIGFFLHIPFPAAQVFATLPSHQELGHDLTEYDVVGLHTRTDVEQLTDYLTRELHAPGRGRRSPRHRHAPGPAAGLPDRDRRARGREDGGLRRGQATGQGAGSLARRPQADRRDRPARLQQGHRRAAARLRAARARRTAKHRRSATLLQISAPSREEVPEYQSMRRSIERLVGHINGRFGEHDWTPVRYLNRTYSRRSVTGFCAISKVGLVTPLRDGLNLVAEEYVAAQPEADPGVLVLSRFAGAAEYLDGALIVNPYDVAGVAKALDQALTMPLEERQERHARMMNGRAHLRHRRLAPRLSGRSGGEQASEPRRAAA